MRAIHLLFRLVIYYFAVGAVVFAGIALIPGIEEFLPIGGAETLLSGPGGDPFESIEIGATRVSNLGDSLIWLLIAVSGAIMTVLPVSWTYMAIRNRDEYDQSLVETIMLLPIAVTSIVIIVHNSLAACVQPCRDCRRRPLSQHAEKFRRCIVHIIGDWHWPGRRIGAMEIAVIMSMAFNFCFLGLWVTDFGAQKAPTVICEERITRPMLTKALIMIAHRWRANESADRAGAGAISFGWRERGRARKPFQMGDASNHFQLARGLTEISGLAVASENSVYAHNDEHGIIYEIALSNGEIVAAFALGERRRGRILKASPP